MPDPSPVPTDPQALKVASLMRGRPGEGVRIMVEPFDLPAGYIVATLSPSGFTVGISPEGVGSS